MSNPRDADRVDGAGATARWRTRGPRALVALALLLLLGVGLRDQLPAWIAGISEAGGIGVLAFVLLYILATVAFLPGVPLSLAAGALFGVVQGTAIVYLGALAGSTAAFLLARTLARPLVARRLTGSPAFQSVDRAIGAGGGRIVFLLRLSPLLPYNVLNYALGLTRVRLPHFVAGSIGMIPGTILYVYSGRLVGDLLAIASGEAAGRPPGSWALLTVGILATALATFYLTRLARTELARTQTLTMEAEE